MGAVRVEWKPDLRVSRVLASRFVALSHLGWIAFCWLCLLIVICDTHWAIDANDYSCGLFTCSGKEGNGNLRFTKKSDCDSVPDVCVSSKTASAFVLFAFFHELCVGSWNFCLFAKSCFSLPYVRMVPSSVFNGFALLLDVIFMLAVFLSWVLYCALGAFDGRWTVGGDFVFCFFIWLFSVWQVVLQIAKYALSPRDDGLVKFVFDETPAKRRRKQTAGGDLDAAAELQLDGGDEVDLDAAVVPDEGVV